MKRFVSLMLLLVCNAGFGQQIIFVRDSIMDGYMKSGYSNIHFRPEGGKNSAGLRHGQWKDFEVQADFAYVTIEGKPNQEFGNFLLYGEGVFRNGTRDSVWKFFVLEDKSFRRILQKQVTYANGVKQGSFVYYFPSGKMGVEGQHNLGEVDGEVRSYYEDGRRYGTRFYKNGLRVGRHTYVYPDGKMRLELGFSSDTLHGLYQSYYPDGQIQESFVYSNGLIDGSYRYFYPDGQLWVEKAYKGGLLMNIVGNFDPKGKPRDKGTLRDGDGTVNYFTEEGKVYAVETYKNGKKVKEVAY